MPAPLFQTSSPAGRMNPPLKVGSPTGHSSFPTVRDEGYLSNPGSRDPKTLPSVHRNSAGSEDEAISTIHVAGKRNSLDLRRLRATIGIVVSIQRASRGKPSFMYLWCPRWESNPHVLWTEVFETTASAIPPLGHVQAIMPQAHGSLLNLMQMRLHAHRNR